MATGPGKATHGAVAAAGLAQLVTVAVTLALLAGTCSAAVVESPPVGVLTLNITNLLTVPINYTVTTTVGEVVTTSDSILIGPGQSKTKVVDLTSLVGGVTGTYQVIIRVGNNVYVATPNLVDLTMAEIGQVHVTVSGPCPDNPDGILVASTTSTGLGNAGPSCVSPTSSSQSP